MNLDLRITGGPGSGNFGHAGRPGLVGGSSDSTNSVQTLTPFGDEQRPDWGTKTPLLKAGDRFLVFRIGRSGESLAGRNAANAEGIVAHLLNHAEYAADPMGDTVTLHQVTLTRDMAEGFIAARGQNVEGEAVSRGPYFFGQGYTFPTSGTGYTSKILGSLPVDQVSLDADLVRKQFTQHPEIRALDSLEAEYGKLVPYAAFFSKYDDNNEAVNIFNSGIDQSHNPEVETVDFESLHATQEDLEVSGIRHYFRGTGLNAGDNPIVLRLNGKNYLIDGHHRAAAEILRGKKTITVDVYDANKLLVLGGKGSGNFGHAGRPGQVGGSAERDAAARNYIKVRPEPALREKYNQAAEAAGREPLTEAEHTLLRAYMDGNYLSFNLPQRDGGFAKWSGGVKTVKPFGSGTKTESNYEAAVATLDAALQKMPVYTGQVTRLALVDKKEMAGLLERYKPGATIVESGFMSATTAEKPREVSFGGLFVGKEPNVEFSIKSVTGRNVALEYLTPHPYEQEVMFGSGSRFRVKSVEKTQHGYRISMEERPKRRVLEAFRGSGDLADNRAAAKVIRGEKTTTADVYDANKLLALGGKGSGNFGHAGRPGQVGGSAPDEGYVDDGGSSWSPMSNAVLKEMLDAHEERSPAVRTLLKELKRRAKKGDVSAQQVHDETVARLKTKSGSGEITSKHGDHFVVTHDPYTRTYTVALPNAPRGVTVAGATLTRDGKRVMSVHVYPEYQRKGIATALYKHIEQHIGGALSPNWALTPEGEAFWNSRSMSEFRAAKKSQIQFNRVNTRAANWAKKHAAELIVDISETSRKAIKKAIGKLIEGEDYNTVVGLIEKAVGDDDRAMLIARHETMTAVSAGQREAWREAVDADALPGNMKRVWIITPINPCPVCEELDGKTADIDGVYPGGSPGPPEHVGCRCTEGLI